MHRLLIALLWALAWLGLVLPPDVTLGRTLAQSPDTPSDWELTSVADAAQRLFTPSSGLLFVQTATQLLRTDDAGRTWQPVTLEPATRLLSSDPFQHAILYAAGPDGLYKTTDDAVTWAPILAYGPTVGGEALALAVSPADPNLVYLAMGGGRGAPGDLRFFRSRDGGLSWQQLEEQHFSLCTWDVPILQPHATDMDRVFRAADCIAGRNFGETLTQSLNAGQSWMPLFNAQPSAPPLLGYPQYLAGEQRLGARRFYLAVNRDRRAGGSSVVRSDDDGATWDEVLAYRGGGSPGFAPDVDPDAPNVRLGGLAYEPAQPDHVYVGRQVFPSFFEPPAGGAVAASSDGGATWADLGRQDIGAVSDLAITVDGQWLFAATDQGVWRWRLGGAGK